MARTLYGGRPGDFVASLYDLARTGAGPLLLALPTDANGDPATVTLEVYDEPDGTQLTDLLAADGTTPITVVVVPTTGQIPAFYAPEGYEADVWLRDPEGDLTRLDAGKVGPEGPAGGVITVNSQSGTVVLDADDVGAPPATRVISAGTGLTGGGDLSADRTLTVDAEYLRDTIAAFVAGSTYITVTHNDAGDTLTIAATGLATATGGGREATAALSATTGTATGNLNNASIFTVTPTGNITLAFSNVPVAGTACTVTVIVTQGATVRTVTPPSGTKWMGAAAPTQVANKACAFTFLTVNGGTTWYASGSVEQ